MLTPAFQLEQFDGFLLIRIKAPYVKSNDVDIYIEDNEFKFYVKPYFLRLYFPCEVIEDGREKAEYNITTGIFKIEIPKKNVGEFFPNLDMLTTLLSTKKKHVMKPIELVSEDLHNEGVLAEKKEDVFETSLGADGNEEDNLNEDSDLCWEVEQELYQPPSILTGYKYGFANKVNGVFSRLQGELYETIDLPDPENTSPEDRRNQRIAAEMAKFDADHYIADYLDDELILDLIDYQAPWDIEYERILDEYKSSLHPETSLFITPKGNPSLFSENGEFIFTDKEKEMLLQLPNKDYLLSKKEEHTVFLSLVDIVFAYAYNHRTTEGENTSESPWTICKISSSLSWLDSFKNLNDVLSSGMRRSLCYPLYRHWLLAQRIVKDLKRLFLLGKRWLLRCLLEISAILQGDENKYILNDLYITDLCVWIQKAKTKAILSLANKLQCMEISKKQIGFPIDDIERNAWKHEYGVESSSGSEEDSSDSSGESDSEYSESDTGSSECLSSSLDSDDNEVSEKIVIKCRSEESCSQKMPSKIEVIQSAESDTFCGMEAVRTGLEKL